MFTGLVRAVGTVREVRVDGDRRIVIGCDWDPDAIAIGASIACSGVCLTAVETGRDADGPWFAVDVSAETCARTTLGGWAAGSRVNLEPSLRVGDELGGHIVSGHVDGVAEIVAVAPEGGSHRLTVAAPAGFGRFVAAKGSVALDGISLTVNEVEDGAGGTRFGVNIIPHTWAVTTLAGAAAGTRLNFEIDVLARYVARLGAAG
ncbi:riboflavin synthase [Paralimibaculum aggregatum]|uniref:Riboflavin synthase n=1 Tax=Paralimibaculum aggregatum TaxID=3036245 RepID=A0ABQ6LLY5_9RHOB|nr:riboflavin synthase [Limibaculum sp. NKW23]GMG81674.1 riboflavin synthase [Limibaculum sp. NKW23]